MSNDRSGTAPPPAVPAPAPVGLGRAGTSVLGLYHMALGVMLSFEVVELWPWKGLDDSKEACANTLVTLMGATKLLGWKAGFSLSGGCEIRLILLVMILGALGSYVHVTTSFADFTGNRMLVSSWVWWYVLRPFIGMALALIFYFAIRGGLLSTSAQAEALSPFGIAAIAALVGMFSKQATQKLKDLFDNLFTKVEHKDALASGAPKGAPRIAAVEPATVAAGSGRCEVTVTGENFTADSVVKVEGIDRPTRFVSARQLIAQLPAEDFTTARTIGLTVSTPGPSGGTSPAVSFTVTPKS